MMELDLSVPDVMAIARLLVAQAGITDCDPDDPCGCQCNCLCIESVSITVDNTVIKTRSGWHVIRARKKQYRNNAAAEKIADRLLQITGINAQATLLYPATGEVQSSNLAGPYNRDDLIRLIRDELR